MATGSSHSDNTRFNGAGAHNERVNTRTHQNSQESAVVPSQEGISSGFSSSLSARGACARDTDELTIVKSLEEPLEDAPDLSMESLDGYNEDRDANNERFLEYQHGNAAAEVTVSMADLAVEGRHNVPLLSPSMGDANHDISLHSRNQFSEPVNPSLSTGFTGSYNSAASNPVNNPSGPPGTGMNVPNYAMNILPSLDEQRVNNTDIPVGIAERMEYSYRTTSTVNSSLPGVGQLSVQEQPPQQAGGQPFQPMSLQQMSLHRHEQQQQQQQQHRNSQVALYHLQPRHLDSPSRTQAIIPYISNEDNTQNLVVSTEGAAPVTDRHMRHPPNMPSMPRGNGAGNHAAFGGRPMSHSGSVSSMRSFIQENCPVRKLPRKILKHVADHLQCRSSSGTWKELVEMYDWNYNKTLLFENQYHQDGPFYSLLREPEFQDYTLEQLRHDLFALPRRDVLTDLNDLITDHNNAAGFSPTVNSAR